MKYLKLFEKYEVAKREYPFNGYSLSSREDIILKNLVGDFHNKYDIKKDDGYYYTNNINNYYNRFDNFNDLRDYIQFNYLMEMGDEDGFIKLLNITNLDISFDLNLPIRWACKEGHTEIVKLLLQDPKVDPSDYYNYAIGLASENGHNEIVKLLLKDHRVDPSDDDNYAIRLASINGHTKVVKLLLQDSRVDPSGEDNESIRWASKNGHKKIVKILLKDPRVRSKLSAKKINKYNNEIS